MSVAPCRSVAGLALELTRGYNQSCAYCYNPERSLEGPAPESPPVDAVLAALSRLLRA